MNTTSKDGKPLGKYARKKAELAAGSREPFEFVECRPIEDTPTDPLAVPKITGGALIFLAEVLRTATSEHDRNILLRTSRREMVLLNPEKLGQPELHQKLRRRMTVQVRVERSANDRSWTAVEVISIAPA